ncbi:MULTISPECIES: nuclear transport factor 2 family protein [unclassified Streptomyces]|uniref:nuclear transport factor 2 family protein n=1 Tax=unclassified Streptomyces TaxID=2593676 RepID=UPI001F11F88D|nr:nuclear transport factor 2 family protein [Streptomyces sp. Tu 4128]
MTITRTSDEPLMEVRESEIESRARVAALLDRYLISLDQEELDAGWAADLFTADAVVAFPISRHEGIEGMADYHAAALSAFAATMHLGSPAVVEVRDGTATLRANLMSTHVHHCAAQDGPPPLFTTGTSVRGSARRTAGGWRLAELTFRLVWSQGSPPSSA